MTLPSAEVLTGRVGVGALVLLAGYLFVDSLGVGLYTMIEENAGTASWTAVVALPIVVVCYVMGVISIGVAQMSIGRATPFNSLDDAATIILLGRQPDLAQSTYAELSRRVELLLGTTIAFVALAAGCLADRSILTNTALGWIVVLVALALSALSLVFAHFYAQRARALASAVRAG